MESDDAIAYNEHDIANLIAKVFAIAYTKPNSDAIIQFEDGNEYICKSLYPSYSRFK